MTPTMREKLARAIVDNSDKPLDAIVDAILNVLREPDDAMIEAGLETNTRFGKPAMRNIWQHMIDTITNEGRR